MDPIWSISVPLTREKLEEQRAVLKQNGIDLQGDSGEASKGVPFGTAKVAYNYDGNFLKLDLLECPRLARGAVKSKIQEWLGKV